MEDTVRQRVADARRIVIKMGTNVIMRDDGAPAVGLVYGIVESAVNVLRSGRQVVIVSSGAIGLGAKSLRLDRSPTELALKQACAAVGQSRLMSMYEDAFRHFSVTTARTAAENRASICNGWTHSARVGQSILVLLCKTWIRSIERQTERIEDC